MLYNQHLEPISTDVTVGTLCLSTPPYTPQFTILPKTSFPYPFCTRHATLKIVRDHICRRPSYLLLVIGSEMRPAQILPMFHFLFINITHLISKTKQTLKFLADLCHVNTLCLCFCETYLHDGIGDIEIHIPEFSMSRCDRLSRVGGGVCIYMKISANFTTCVNYSNSVCELLILILHTPIVILMYRPPSCTINEFDYVIIKVNQFIFSL